MTRRELICPKCGHKFYYRNFLAWALKTPLRKFNFELKKDKRYTECPNCGIRSWLYSEKVKYDKHK